MQKKLLQVTPEPLSPYVLTSSNRTNGIVDDEHIDAYNRYGSAPIHVALQAGAIDELVQILRMGADPRRLSEPGHNPSFFIKLYREANAHRSEARFVAAIMTKKMINATKAWEKKYGPLPEPVSEEPPYARDEVRLVLLRPKSAYDTELASMKTHGLRNRAAKSWLVMKTNVAPKP